MLPGFRGSLTQSRQSWASFKANASQAGSWTSRKWSCQHERASSLHKLRRTKTRASIAFALLMNCKLHQLMSFTPRGRKTANEIFFAKLSLSLRTPPHRSLVDIFKKSLRFRERRRLRAEKTLPDSRDNLRERLTRLSVVSRCCSDAIHLEKSTSAMASGFSCVMQ